MGLLLTAIAAFLLVTLFPVGDVLLRPLERTYAVEPPLEEVTGILVLGGSEEMDASSTWGPPQTNDAGDRLIAAAELARRFPEAVVLVSGGRAGVTITDTSGDNVPAGVLERLGVPRERILVEGRSRNTAENAAFSRDRLGGEPSGTWVLVTSAFHMPRAMATFCAAGWTNLVAWPSDFRSGGLWPAPSWDFAGHLHELNLATKEWVGWLAYRWTGRLSQGACRAN